MLKWSKTNKKQLFFNIGKFSFQLSQNPSYEMMPQLFIFINLDRIVVVVKKTIYKNVLSNLKGYSSHCQSMQPYSENKIWAKLLPLSKGLNTYPLRDNEILIGRSNCKITISEKRLSGKHCLIQKENAKVYITDFSTNGTYLNTEKIGKNNRLELKDGDEVWLLPVSRVSQDETIGFKFSMIGQQPPKSRQTEDSKLINSIKEQITCSLCLNVMILAVTVQPCNHRFCGPCLTALVNKKKGTCTICRKELLSAVRDATFNAIIADYLKSHPEQKVGDQDENPNIFGYEPTNIRAIINQNYQEAVDQIKTQNTQRKENRSNQQYEPMDIEKTQRRVSLQPHQMEVENTQKNKRQEKKQTKPRKKQKKAKAFISSDISASTDSQIEQVLPPQVNQKSVCKECDEQRNGFKCPKNQVHVNCHNCTKPFARREDEKLNQKCVLCGSFFCNLYLPPCQINGAKLIQLGKRGPTCTVQPLVFRNNKVEMDSFKYMLVAMKKTLGDMFKEMVELADMGRFQFMYDKRLLRGQVANERRVPLNKRSPVCDNCWRELWFQMIFVYMRQNIDMVSEAIKKRPACYWGVNCKTMAHNLEHAKRYNHMQEQTRFT